MKRLGKVEEINQSRLTSVFEQEGEWSKFVILRNFVGTTGWKGTIALPFGNIWTLILIMIVIHTFESANIVVGSVILLGIQSPNRPGKEIRLIYTQDFRSIKVCLPRLRAASAPFFESSTLGVELVQK